jgi:uncharacterized protein with NRDE domain
MNDCPVLVAANREESYARPGTPPELWPGDTPFVAGRDPQAGGTWLGVNSHGVLAAVTNRAKRPPAAPRSRGLLCRDLLACRTAREAHDRALAELAQHPYAGCNVLAIDTRDGYVLHADDVLQSIPLLQGIHIVTSRDLNDTSDHRIAHAIDQLARLNTLNTITLPACFERLPALLRDHGGPDHPPICLHAGDRGTVSSAIVALARRPHASRWLHAQGPPCAAPFEDYSHLLASLPSPA